MRAPIAAGDVVQTPLGKGVVREARSGGKYLVEVSGKHWVVAAADVSPIESKTLTKPRVQDRKAPPDEGRSVSGRQRELDLHGFTVAEALVAASQAISDAIVDDCRELRLIHGRSGGRLRAALHQRLPEIPTVRGVRMDPHNPGVTIVSL